MTYKLLQRNIQTLSVSKEKKREINNIHNQKTSIILFFHVCWCRLVGTVFSFSMTLKVDRGVRHD
jgi:hypothetical protein